MRCAAESYGYSKDGQEIGEVEIEGYFLPSGGFAAGPFGWSKRLASGLRGLQPAGGKETRQKRALGWSNSIPTSGSSCCPALMSFTLQANSSPVATCMMLRTC